MIGPILGGWLYGKYGYVNTLNYVMVGEAVVTVVFLIFNCGPLVYKNQKADQEILDKMKEIKITLDVLEEEGELDVSSKNNTNSEIKEEPELELY